VTCFADAAARLAGQAGAYWGWSPDAFWRATPAELATLVGAVAGAVSEGAATPPEAGVLARLREEHPDG